MEKTKTRAAGKVKTTVGIIRFIISLLFYLLSAYIIGRSIWVGFNLNNYLIALVLVVISTGCGWFIGGKKTKQLVVILLISIGIVIAGSYIMDITTKKTDIVAPSKGPKVYSLQELDEFLYIPTETLIKTLGSDYQILSYELDVKGYYYKKLGLEFFIYKYPPSQKSYVYQIKCYRFNFNGATHDSEFTQIRQILGHAPLKVRYPKEDAEADWPVYCLNYDTGAGKVRFESSDIVGTDSWAIITGGLGSYPDNIDWWNSQNPERR